MAKENGAQRFMRATGKLRAVFGPANRSSLVHDMTEENRKLLAQREAETQQWETVTKRLDARARLPLRASPEAVEQARKQVRRRVLPANPQVIKILFEPCPTSMNCVG